MKRGIDAATLDLLPLDMRQNFGFKAPLFDHTCTKGNKVRIGEVRPIALRFRTSILNLAKEEIKSE